MKPKELSIIGVALYGEYWQRALAEYLNVNDRTVRRWYAGVSAMPETLPHELAVLCREHATKLKELAKQLS
jgi:DNA-binding transcriptional regulator YiaG